LSAPIETLHLSFNHCNSEDGKRELHVHLFTILASVWLQLCQLTSW